MEQLTHLVERMSARFVILETQLKLVEPQEQKAPPSSLTGNTTWTTLPLSENHGMKMVTVAERAASPLHYDKNTGSQPPPPLLAPSQTDTETPAKMRSILKHPSSCHVAAGRELLPPCPSPTSSRHMASATPLNSWAACSPLNWSPYSKSNDQRSREIQSPSKCIYPRSPAKPWSVYQATGGLHSTPTTPVSYPGPLLSTPLHLQFHCPCLCSFKSVLPFNFHSSDIPHPHTFACTLHTHTHILQDDTKKMIENLRNRYKTSYYYRVVAVVSSIKKFG